MLFLFKPNIKDIWPARENWELHEDQGNMIFWFTDKRDMCRLQFTGRCDWQFDLNNFTQAKLFYENQCGELGGALVEIEKQSIQGMESLVGIFKYKSPEPNRLAMYYVGIIWIAFENCTYQVNFESLERGTTGAREAATYLNENPELVQTEEEPVMLESEDELLKFLGDKPVQVYPSDDEKYDDAFPDHPLSKVRMLISQFKEDAKINNKIKKLKPYRVKNG